MLTGKGGKVNASKQLGRNEQKLHLKNEVITPLQPIVPALPFF